MRDIICEQGWRFGQASELTRSSVLDSHAAPPFLAGGGEMGALIRVYRWAATPLSDASVWPLELKTLVSLLLTSPQPMFIAWGSKRTWLYNDAFTPILGDKHPSAAWFACDAGLGGG